MNVDYMLACGIVWQKKADPTAGWELIAALGSSDPWEREIAQTILVDAGERSMDLLEDAIRAGFVSPEAAGACMAEILRTRTQLPIAYSVPGVN